MKKCVYCGKEYDDDATVCATDERPLTRVTQEVFQEGTTEGTTENTSGQGQTVRVPEAVKRWNWGAFFFSWIWGLCNGVPVRFWVLTLIPIINMAWVFVVGANGSEWAWRYKRWQGLEHFQTIQKRWSYAALGFFIVALTLGVLGALTQRT